MITDERIIKTPMKSYYECRKCIQQLYLNDVRYTGDLAATLLELRDQISCIDSISIQIQSLKIIIDLSDSTTQEDISNVCFKIHSAISIFIYNNIAKVTDEDTAAKIRENIKNNGIKYYELINIGNSITVLL